MQRYSLRIFCLISLVCASAPFARAAAAAQTTSLNSEVVAVPATGAVEIDGNTDDWDLSAGVWSYNSPELVDSYSIWTHLMWDERGLYYLARIHDLDPLKNATKGVDFGRGWKGDAVQLRMIFDDHTPEEHQMHLTLYHSTAEHMPYLIVKHGGHRNREPYDNTGPDRPDLLARFGETMTAVGGRVATRAWPDGKGYNIEAFMPWSYLRMNGRALKPGDRFVLGWETLWAKPTRAGEIPDTSAAHRLADGVKSAAANRIFMFRARNDWGAGVIGAKGNLGITEEQRRLQQNRLASLNDLSTAGSVPIRYELPNDGLGREVTIAIDNEKGERVRHLFGQYPRPDGQVTDHWDGLDDAGKPVAPGRYTATVVDHAPIKLELLTTLYNAGTPPWSTEEKNVTWGSDHGAASVVATYGDRVVAAFSMPEAGRGMCSLDLKGGAEWSTRNSAGDIVITDRFIYSFEFDIWQKKFLVSRIEPNTGRVVPFVRKDGAQVISMEIEVSLPVTQSSSAPTAITEAASRLAITERATVGFDGVSLWLLIPGQKLLKLDPGSGEITETRPPGDLNALRSRGGRMYGLFGDKTVWLLDEALGRRERIADFGALRRPGRFAISQDFSRVAACDVETHQVFVQELAAAAGRASAMAVIGKPKPGLTDRPAGVFDREDVMKPVSVDFDSRGRIWVAEATSNIHRTSVWSAEGRFVDEYWGAAPYGATNGFKFEFDACRFIAVGLEFRLDPNIDPSRRKSAEVPLFYHPQLSGTFTGAQGTVYRVKDKAGRDHEFAVSAPGGLDNRALVIFRRAASGEFVPAAGLFAPITSGVRRERTPYSAQLGESKLTRAWVDRDGDGRIQDSEIITEGVKFGPYYWSAGWVRPDMSIFTPAMVVYPLKEISAQGVPVYDFSQPHAAPNPIPVADRASSCGTPVIDRAGNISDGIAYHTSDGRRGAYPNRFGRHDAPAAQRGLLIAPFRTNGVVEDIPGVGSATVLQGDRGEWFMLSMDGLYITNLFQDIKGKLTMDATLIDGESFGGHFWRVSDGPMKGKVLVQSGKTAYTIFEVKNLETVRRQTVRLEVSADDIKRGQEIAAAGRAGARDEGPLVLAKVKELPARAPAAGLGREAALVDGQPFTLVEEAGNPSRWFKVSLLADEKDLALVWQVADPTPWRNGADLFTHAFAGGDAVDFQFVSPTQGPVRLLAAPSGRRAQAVYWRQNAPTKENAQTYVVANNVANARKFDVVKILTNARIDTDVGPDGYTVLLRAPLSDLGLDSGSLPATLRGLAGVIFSDTAGTNRVARLYWHNKATGMVNDVPTESAVEPDRFGEIPVRP